LRIPRESSSITVPPIEPSEVVLCPGRTPESVLMIEVIAEGLPPDKPQDNLID
jgi:hypothetical protein